MSDDRGDRKEPRPVLVPAGNMKPGLASPGRKKPLRKVEKEEEDKKKVTPSGKAARTVLRRQETLLHSNLSLNASCSSDCSMESFRSRASTGRIGSRTSRRKQGLPRPETIISKIGKIVPEDVSPPQMVNGKRRCPWVTPNTDPCYVTFHDEEWGVPIHDDNKLFEILVLSGALAELAWPAILSKRETFREVFLDFDPAAVSKLNEKKLIAKGSMASFLLSEPKLRGIVENARQILKIIEEFGSFDRYCWNFVNHKPIVSRFRYSRQVPVKTPKADVISKDMVRRGFRSVGPTVIYTFMQVAGITNDHLISCYRFEECCSPSLVGGDKNDEPVQCHRKMEEISNLAALMHPNTMIVQKDANIDLELAKVVEDLSISQQLLVDETCGVQL